VSHKITLYAIDFTRSARCRWTLLELGMEFDEIADRSLIGSDELRAIHPQAKVPAIVIDDEPLFESAAICTYLCDLTAEKGLISPAGSRGRALHGQWTSFVLTEMEAYLWSNVKHTNFYPEEKRVPEIVASNNEEVHAAAQVLNEALAEEPFLIGGQFSVTDIIVGWTVNWARRGGHLDGFTHLAAYLDRLFARQHCPLNPA
jgi:glutathione S-transferase